MSLPGRGARAVSFGDAAASYERGRPSYPPEAVDWLLPDGAARVVDLGAGTGKLTAALMSRGVDVVAVEPSAGMREELQRAVPGALVVDGTAEALPLQDASVDAVLVAQAWHWVDPGRAVPEVARVLRPGGRLGLVWNVRDERDPWMAGLAALLRSFGEVDDSDVEPTIGPPFGPMQRCRVEWRYSIPAAQVMDLVASRSYVIVMPAHRREEVLGRVQAYVDAARSDDPEALFTIPYVTYCSRTELG